MLEKLAKIKALAMDVDGTLTDGAMIFYRGEQIKLFNVYDGLGVRLATTCGLRIAWITSKVSEAVDTRAKSLGVTDVYQDARYKTEALKDLAKRYNIEPEEIAYVGDDLNDLPAFSFVGVKIAVSNAAQDLKDRADYVTKLPGGHGAVREIIEMIFKARGEWDKAVESYLCELEQEEAGKAGPEAVA